MKKIRLRKTKISIQNIGKQRFWFGFFAGFFTAISISLLFNQVRTTSLYFSAISSDLQIINKQDLLFFNCFFASLSSVLGLAITISIWMNNRTNKRKMDNVYKQMARTNALFIFWLILMIITRLGSVFLFVLQWNSGTESLFNFHNYFWLTFVLLPIVIFAQSWFMVRRIYKAEKWILLSLLICLITSFFLSKTTSYDPEKFNNIYSQRFIKDYRYIDKEISIAKKKYGIEYDAKTITTLKRWHTKNSLEQVNELKKSLSRETKVSLDTIILQKIVIHNYKKGNLNHYNYYNRNILDDWHYALPKDILHQIGLHKNNSNETKELFHLLKEQIHLINTPRIEWDNNKNYTETERRISNEIQYKIPDVLISQLMEVRDSLMNMKKYNALNKTLPKIKRTINH